MSCKLGSLPGPRKVIGFQFVQLCCWAGLGLATRKLFMSWCGSRKLVIVCVSQKEIFFLFGYVFFLTDHKDQLRKEGANRFHSPGEHLVLCRGGGGCRWLHLSWQPGSKGTGTPTYSRQLSEVSRQSKVTRPERGKAGSRTRLQCRGPSHESTSPALLVLPLAEVPLNASDVHLARCSSQPNQQVVRCRVSQRHLRDEAKTWSGTGVSPWARAGKLPGRGAP